MLDRIDIATEASLRRETVRLCQRYVEEVVLRFDLCPWAAPALKNGHVDILVITNRISTLDQDALAAITATRAALATATERPQTELALLCFPLCTLGRLDFDALLRRLRDAEPRRTPFALAAFHPEAAPDNSDPERLIPFLRRSPHPLLQAVRSERLDAIDPSRGSGTAFFDVARLLAGELPTEPSVPLRRRVALANAQRVAHEGLSALEAAFDAIAHDRDQVHAALGLPRPRFKAAAPRST